MNPQIAQVFADLPLFTFCVLCLAYGCICDKRQWNESIRRGDATREQDARCLSFQIIPTVIAVPLKGDDPDVPLDLQKAMNLAVERGSYDLDTDFDQDPVPPLAEAHRDWARGLIKSWKAERSEA